MSKRCARGFLIVALAWVAVWELGWMVLAAPVAFAALYGLGLIAARLHRPTPAVVPAMSAAPVVHARETVPYEDGPVTFGHENTESPE